MGRIILELLHCAVRGGHLAYGNDAEFYANFRTLEGYTRSVRANITLMVRSDSDFFRSLQDISLRRR